MIEKGVIVVQNEIEDCVDNSKRSEERYFGKVRKGEVKVRGKIV